MTLLLLAAIALSLAGVAAGVLVIAAGDRHFDQRVIARLPKRPAAAEHLRIRGQALRLRALSTLDRWGRKAGRGALDTEARDGMRRELVHAGFLGERAVEIFFGVRALAAAGLTGAGAALGLAAGLGLPWILAVALGLGNIGLFGPVLWLRGRIVRRAAALTRGLPDVADLLVLAVEAGATIPAAVKRVVAELDDLHPELCELLALMLEELQAGASRADALARLARRSPGEAVRALTTVLIQSDAVGASLGAALRTAADELRRSRYLDAERRAAELPVKLAFPLVFCIFPCLMGVIFTPVAVLFLRSVLRG